MAEDVGQPDIRALTFCSELPLCTSTFEHSRIIHADTAPAPCKSPLQTVIYSVNA